MTSSNTEEELGESKAAVLLRVKDEIDLGLRDYGFVKKSLSPYGGRVWLFGSSITGPPLTLDQQLTAILDYLDEKQMKDVLEDDSVLGRALSCYWCGYRGHGGPSLTPATLARVADYGLELWFDCYDVSDQEPEGEEAPESN